MQTVVIILSLLGIVAGIIAVVRRDILAAGLGIIALGFAVLSPLIL